MNMDAMGLTIPEETYTLDDFIGCQNSNDITYYNFSLLEKYNGVEHLDTNLIEEYLPELMELAEKIELQDDQMKKYRMKPDILAYDIYGSTQLDAFILMMNDMIDPKEFTNKYIKLVRRSYLMKFFSGVFGAETGLIDYNREKVWNS